MRVMKIIGDNQFVGIIHEIVLDTRMSHTSTFKQIYYTPTPRALSLSLSLSLSIHL